MKNFINWLKNSHHLQYSLVFFAVAIINLFALQALGASTLCCIIGSLITATTAGFAIEIKEEMSGGVFSWQDVFADYLGYGIAVLLFLIAIAI